MIVSYTIELGRACNVMNTKPTNAHSFELGVNRVTSVMLQLDTSHPYCAIFVYYVQVLTFSLRKRKGGVLRSGSVSFAASINSLKTLSTGIIHLPNHHRYT